METNKGAAVFAKIELEKFNEHDWANHHYGLDYIDPDGNWCPETWENGELEYYLKMTSESDQNEVQKIVKSGKVTIEYDSHGNICCVYKGYRRDVCDKYED